MSIKEYATDLANTIEGAAFGAADDGLHLAPTDLEIVVRALRTLAETFVSALTPAIDSEAV